MKLKITSFGAALLFGIASAYASSPVGCGNGNDDNTCLKAAKFSSPQFCSTAAGWTTTTAASVVNCSWVAPVCHYAPQPTCAPPTVQQSPATWNGSNWVGLTCVMPGPNPPLEQGACAQFAYNQEEFSGLGGMYMVDWGYVGQYSIGAEMSAVNQLSYNASQMSGPATGGCAKQGGYYTYVGQVTKYYAPNGTNTTFDVIGWGGYSNASTTYLHPIGDLQANPSGAYPHEEAVCFVETGTNNVVCFIDYQIIPVCTGT